jgi:pimeloyl-ACP methyl ester carboxylesterase
VIGYDHRGTGRTVATPDEITHDDLVHDLFALLDRAGIRRCVLGGFSSGASVVVDAVTAEPDRFAGLLLMCPVFLEPGSEVTPLPEAEFDSTIESFLDLCFPEAAHRDVSSVRRWAHSVLHQSSAENATQLMLALQGSQPMADYRPLTHPAAIVIGADDPMSNESDLEGWTRLFPGARVPAIPEAGHIVAFTAADEVNRALLDLVESVS